MKFKKNFSVEGFKFEIIVEPSFRPLIKNGGVIMHTGWISMSDKNLSQYHEFPDVVKFTEDAINVHSYELIESWKKMNEIIEVVEQLKKLGYAGI